MAVPLLIVISVKNPYRSGSSDEFSIIQNCGRGKENKGRKEESDICHIRK
jgi:hypothetical protein